MALRLAKMGCHNTTTPLCHVARATASYSGGRVYLYGDTDIWVLGQRYCSLTVEGAGIAREQWGEHLAPVSRIPLWGVNEPSLSRENSLNLEVWPKLRTKKIMKNCSGCGNRHTYPFGANCLIYV